MSKLRLFLFTVSSALAACSNDDADRPETVVLSFDEAPLVYGLYDPPGTFLSTVGDTSNPKRINDVYTFNGLSLSPGRRHLLQSDVQGSVSSGEAVFELATPGSKLAAFEWVGGFLGWDGDDTMLYAASQIEGVLRVDVGGQKKLLPFPSWVLRDSVLPTRYVVSPDGRAAAFLVRVDPSVSPEGFALFATDTRTGSLLATWPLTSNVFPGNVFWAEDGTIVYQSLTAPFVVTTRLNSSSFSAPFELPFQACSVGGWIEPDVLYLTERVQQNDTWGCANSWLMGTDGSNLVKRDGPSPMSISPDRKKILYYDASFEIAMSEPDGSNAVVLPGLAKAHALVW
jgi:hypothetical protein